MKGKPFFDRMYGRALAWRWMLSRSKGHFGFELGLAASGLLDIARFFVSPRNHPMPIVYGSGVVHIRTSLGEFRFCTRRATDDVYSWLPSREIAGEERTKNLLRKGDTFVDVGSNAGYYSVLAGRALGPSGRFSAGEVLTKPENLVVEVSGRPDEIRAFLEQASFRVRALKFKPYLWASRG